jgi:hypothetical protein
MRNAKKIINMEARVKKRKKRQNILGPGMREDPRVYSG